MKLPKLILASGSPRRAEILTSVGWEFTKASADIDETELPGEDPAAYVRRLAVEKAEAVAALHANAFVLGADTTVVVDDAIIGKPLDLADARRMLRMLSGRWHEVLTGVALVKTESLSKNQSNRSSGIQKPKSRAESPDRPKSGIPKPRLAVGLQVTQVKFSPLTEREIDFLAERGDPLDKAGAYAVQAQAALFIEEIRGDYWNVVGLPVSLVYGLIRDLT